MTLFTKSLIWGYCIFSVITLILCASYIYIILNGYKPYQDDSKRNMYLDCLATLIMFTGYANAVCLVLLLMEFGVFGNVRKLFGG